MRLFARLRRTPALTFLFLCLAYAESCNSSSFAAEKPRLVVVVSVDQLPFEYLLRMKRGFAADGFFNAVWKKGAVYDACHHGQALTITGPGHSVLLTGAYPNTTGIVDNEWLDRATGKMVYCVADEAVKVVGGPGSDGMSPKKLEVGTLGDQLKLATNGRAKVIGVALKDRAAILMAGHMADAAYWYDPAANLWVTSSYYRPALPDYLQAYNASEQPKQYAGRTWELLLEAKVYEHYYPDNSPWESNVPTLGRAFPHPMPKADDKSFGKNMPISPFGTEMTLAVTRLVASEEKLGADDDTDLLCINLSSNDYVGHQYGPYSLEVQDMTYRTDRMLGEFTKFLDKLAGPGRWTLALSSDHGVGPIPEHAVAMKLPARRVPMEHFKTLERKIEAALVERFGALTAGKKYVTYSDANIFYLDDKLEQLRGEKFIAAQELVRDLLLVDDAVFAAYTREQLIHDNDATELFARMRFAFHLQRSGDVLYCLKPYYLAGSTTASHGSPWEYDTHVPLLLLGAGVTAGIYDRPVTPPMIAPTLARITGVDAPSGCTVEPLYEVLKRQ